MKRKEKTAFHEMTVDALKKQDGELMEELTQLFIHKRSSQTKNTREARVLRKKRAVIASIAKEKEFSHE